MGDSTLPRLGSQGANHRQTHEIDLPATGASILIAVPASLAALERALECFQGDPESAPPSQSLAAARMLLADMLIEPELSAEEIGEQIYGPDWRVLEKIVDEHSGLSGAAERQARTEFPDEGLRQEVQVPAGPEPGDDGGGDAPPDERS